MLPSPVPTLVFTSLAASCVPAFSDRRQVLLQEDRLGTYSIHRPISSAAIPELQDPVGFGWSGQRVDDHSVLTAFDQTRPEGDVGMGYRGSVLHVWDNDYRPTCFFAAQISGDASRLTRAAATVMAPPTYMPTPVPLRMAWLSAGASHGQQFMNAVLLGRRLAACGAAVTVVGEQWPEPPAPTPQARCPICTQAVYGAWAGMDYMRGTR